MIKPRNIGSLSMKGGRKDNFYFCLIEHYANAEEDINPGKHEDRWFLKSLLPVKEEEEENTDDVIRSWIEKFNVEQLVVDFPLTNPKCQSCELDCPGVKSCPQTEVVTVNKKMEELLAKDQELLTTNPKKYEQDRNRADEIVYNKNIFEKETHHHLLSRSFKRRLKKGYIPYWNRPIDLWMWKYYYDPILEMFNTSFDSFGHTSLMMLSRFAYLKRHFPKSLELFEANEHVILIELLRSKLILKKDVLSLQDIDLGIESRFDFIKKVEKELNIFIYNHDLEILVKNPRAFDSFLLALAGQNVLQKKNRTLPDWTKPTETRFVVPHF
ncbi:MAG: hypothetical protein L6Q33_15080 [Bacteriovoracaceae bacterium]|nr:hypothetical protein [Bacteriovoracaceae bacterium]